MTRSHDASECIRIMTYSARSFVRKFDQVGVKSDVFTSTQPAKTTLFAGDKAPGLRRNFLRPKKPEVQLAKTTLFASGKAPGLRRNFLRPKKPEVQLAKTTLFASVKAPGLRRNFLRPMNYTNRERISL